MRTLRHPETSTLSFVSAITLCIRSDCSLWQLVRPSLHSVSSLNCRSTAAFIRSPRQLLQSDTGDPHFALDPLTYRCPESFSRCKLRWTTSPSPQLMLLSLCLPGELRAASSVSFSVGCASVLLFDVSSRIHWDWCRWVLKLHFSRITLFWGRIQENFLIRNVFLTAIFLLFSNLRKT